MTCLLRRGLIGGALLSLLDLSVAQAQAQALESPIDVDAGRIDLRFDERMPPELRPIARRWAARAAAAVAGYFGRFPLPEVELLLQTVDGAGVKGGTTYGEPAPHIRVRIGRDTAATQLDDDWILVHEMIHLAVPRVPRSQSWLHEGIATYVEGVARVRAGQLDAARFWAEAARDMPQGLPQVGDRGLDHTPTWGRRYWGGAIFCLLADVQMRLRSGGRAGLQQALQGVLAAGGSYVVAWPVERILRVADSAVGQTALTELHAMHADRPVPVNLDALFADLGVTASGGLRGDAPLSALRRAIAA